MTFKNPKTKKISDDVITEHEKETTEQETVPSVVLSKKSKASFRMKEKSVKALVKKSILKRQIDMDKQVQKKFDAVD